MSRQHHRAGTQAVPRGMAPACALTLAALLALCVLAAAPAAFADEVEGEGSFDFNLSLGVSAADDPDAAVCPVSVHVSNRDGEHVGGAKVAYELRSAYAGAPSARVSGAAPASVSAGAAQASPAAAQAASGMVRAGTATTSADGTADLAGVVAGCDYLVAVEADGHVRYERVHACKGEDGERWEVVMEKAGGSPGGSGADAGAGPLASLSSLMRTGDALGPLVLGAAGSLMAALGLVALARRRGRGARDGR